MKIHEYQAKQLLQKYGVKVPRGVVVRRPDEVEDAYLQLSATSGTVVIKAQIHAGGRGKAGGVRLVHGLDEARSVVAELLGRPLVTAQTGPEGRQVRALLFEEALPIARELYAGLVLDREQARVVLMTSAEGGVEIEQVAASSPEKILRASVDPLTGLMPYQVRRLAFAMGLDRQQVARAVEMFGGLARAFFFRSTGARLDVHLDFLILEGATPVEGRPGMNAAAEDLERRGVLFLDEDAIHVVTGEKGRNLSGHLFPKGMVGSMGSDANAFYPGTDPETDYRACWTLVHEFQHTLMIFSQRSPEGPCMLSGHFLDDIPLPPGLPALSGPFYAGEHEVLERFHGYGSLPTPLRAWMETNDRDGDGLPDEDARLPMDEARFGSDPTRADTDGDGLNDLEEFRAGIYGGTDPRRPDTDGDGLPDGIDPYPLSDFSGVIPRAALRPGELPPGRLSTTVFFSPCTPPPPFRIRASWDDRFLYFAFRSDRPFSVTIHLDGSGRLGPFASDRRIAPAEGPGPPAGDVYTREAALHAVFGDPRLLRGDIPVTGARVLSLEKGGVRILWVAVPAALGPGTRHCRILDDAVPSRGLTLKQGRSVGLAFTFVPCAPETAAPEASTPNPCFAYEPHRFLTAVLENGP